MSEEELLKEMEDGGVLVLPFASTCRCRLGAVFKIKVIVAKNGVRNDALPRCVLFVCYCLCIDFSFVTGKGKRSPMLTCTSPHRQSRRIHALVLAPSPVPVPDRPASVMTGVHHRTTGTGSQIEEAAAVVAVMVTTDGLVQRAGVGLHGSATAAPTFTAVPG